MSQLPIVSQQLLVAKGIELANELNFFLSRCVQGRVGNDYFDNPTNNWNPKLQFLAFLAYAVSMAKFSDLDRDDFLALATGCFDGIDVTPREDTASGPLIETGGD